jgi:hypothetical protein
MNFEVNYGNKWKKIPLSCVLLSENHVIQKSRTLQWVWHRTRQDVINNDTNISVFGFHNYLFTVNRLQIIQNQFVVVVQK